jgi:hypothetical protein
MKIRFTVLVIFLMLACVLHAQRKSLRDSSYRLPIVGLQFSGQMPAGDMAKRFGSSLSVGLPVFYKTSKNLIFGIEGNYLYGSNIKEHIMSNLVNSNDNTITDVNGNPASFRLNERGWSVYGYVGVLISKLGHNKNSGVLALAGAGYMQHKINIFDAGRSIAQLEGNLKKGYDRLTGGPSLAQFIGYMFMSQNRIANFYAGFEFQEGFTKGLRGYQYDTMASDGQSRLDILYGFRLGWLLPLYKKAPKDFYYY